MSGCWKYFYIYFEGKRHSSCYLGQVDEEVCAGVECCGHVWHMSDDLYPPRPHGVTSDMIDHHKVRSSQDTYSWNLCSCITSQPLMIHLMLWLMMKTMTMTRLTLASLTSLVYWWPSQPGHWELLRYFISLEQRVCQGPCQIFLNWTQFDLSVLWLPPVCEDVEDKEQDNRDESEDEKVAVENVELNIMRRESEVRGLVIREGADYYFEKWFYSGVNWVSYHESPLTEKCLIGRMYDFLLNKF